MDDTTVSASSTKFGTVWGAARLVMGVEFLWAFVDKLFGLGFSTAADRAWLTGGSPTQGYLSGSYGPLEGFYKAIAGEPVTDLLFMLGLFAVGIALLLGMGVRVAGWSGALMVALMYTSHTPWVKDVAGTATRSTNPLLDSHVLEGLVLVGFALTNAGVYLGLGRWWQGLPVVKKYPWLA